MSLTFYMCCREFTDDEGAHDCNKQKVFVCTIPYFGTTDEKHQSSKTFCSPDKICFAFDRIIVSNLINLYRGKFSPVDFTKSDPFQTDVYVDIIQRGTEGYAEKLKFSFIRAFVIIDMLGIYAKEIEDAHYECVKSLCGEFELPPPTQQDIVSFIGGDIFDKLIPDRMLIDYLYQQIGLFLWDEIVWYEACKKTFKWPRPAFTKFNFSFLETNG